MKTKILMIYPEFPITYWGLQYALRFVGKKAATIPLGLLTVAALLPDSYSVKLVDMNIKKLTKSDIKEADLVFISSMIIQKASFEKVVALCNRMNVPVVAGGPYPTSSYTKISGVDYFVLNEAEITLPPFLYDYENGIPKNLYYNTEKPDITQTPPPRFDLIDFKDYNNVALQNSRGCPFNCEFCDIIELYGRKPRFKNAPQFIKEMDLVYQHGFRGSVFVVDDNFIGNKKKVKNLLSAIIEWQREHDFPFSLFTEASINLADDDELLHLMVEAGFDMVFVGIETPEKNSLKACGKTQNVKTDLLESIDKIQRNGIEVTGGFIVGFDEDTEDIFERQIDFIQNAGIPLAMVGILGALPNTQLYRRLMKEGRLRNNKDFTGNNTHNLQMSFTPVMEEKKIIDGYKKIISEIYNPKNYFERCFDFIKKLPAGKSNVSRSITLTDIKAFFLSLFKQTFSRYSIYYLKFLWKVLIYKRHCFPHAVEHAIKGYHFFKITNVILEADQLSAQLQKAKIILNGSLAALDNRREMCSRNFIKFTIAIAEYTSKIEKTFTHLSRDVQQHLHDEFNEYIHLLHTYIYKMNELHVKYQN